METLQNQPQREAKCAVDKADLFFCPYHYPICLSLKQNQDLQKYKLHVVKITLWW